MPTALTVPHQEDRKSLRDQARAARNARPNKDEVSRRICTSFAALPEYTRAGTVMCYVHVRSEVRTRHFLPTVLTHGKRVVVPYCVAGKLELFLLESMEELTEGAYGILEPRVDLRLEPAKRLGVRELDLIMVPGLAFDRTGARLGHGLGYYDKLLEHARPDTPLVALAFECQLVPRIPTQPYDICMDKIVTESATYQGRRASRTDSNSSASTTSN